MNRSTKQELLSAFLDDALDDADRALVERLLREDEEAARELAQYRAMRGALGQLPVPEVPSLARGVLARLTEEEEGSMLQRFLSLFKGSPVLATALSLGLVAVVFVGFLAYLGSPVGPAKYENQVAEGDKHDRLAARAPETKTTQDPGVILEKIFEQSRQTREEREESQRPVDDEGSRVLLDILRQTQGAQSAPASSGKPATFVAKLGVYRRPTETLPAQTRARQQAQPDEAFEAEADPAAATDQVTSLAGAAAVEATPEYEAASVFLSFGRAGEDQSAALPQLLTTGVPEDFDALALIRGQLGTFHFRLHLSKEGKVSRVEQVSYQPKDEPTAQVAESLTRFMRDWEFRPVRLGPVHIPAVLDLTIPVKDQAGSER
jgi:hypothetical protein